MGKAAPDGRASLGHIGARRDAEPGTEQPHMVLPGLKVSVRRARPQRCLKLQLIAVDLYGKSVENSGA